MSGSRGLAGTVTITAFALLSLASCRAKTESEIIAGLVAEIAAAVEKRDAAALIGHLSADYLDFEDRDRERTAAMIEDYFSRYRGIVIHFLSSRIQIESPRHAVLETDVSLSSGAAQAFRKMVRFSGENYRFRCRLRKETRWLVVGAEWEFMAVEGLFPESIKLLRELFPNL